MAVHHQYSGSVSPFFPGEDRNPGRGDGRGGMILRREDVARAPAHVGAQLDERLDEHGGLDGHVQ